MSLNQNEHILELLSWHGQDRGGVHVPFQQNSKPITSTIVTDLINRLRVFAEAIANDSEQKVRWLFLIGGPGNGKSEAVEDFIRHLDHSLGLKNVLIDRLTEQFRPHADHLTPRRVVVTSEQVTASTFQQRIGELRLIQDATASEKPDQDAALILAEEIHDLLDMPGSLVPPLVIVCANRGLLARTLRAATQLSGPRIQETRDLLSELIRSSSIGVEVSPRLPCWPLQSNEKVACWPLDFVSLLQGSSGITSPFEQIVTEATATNHWEQRGICEDCDSNVLCPFRQNAVWLREDSNRQQLSTTLRYGELYLGQRWNFRDTFSLLAELMVGQRDDFADFDHPCQWVHVSVASAGSQDEKESMRSIYALTLHLYPHALFPVSWMSGLAEELQTSIHASDVAEAVLRLASEGNQVSDVAIRQKFRQEYSSLDPATYSPQSRDHLLRKIEDAYSQSVEIGNRGPFQQDCALSNIEKRFLAALDTVEKSIDVLGRDASYTSKLIIFIRKLSTQVAKRSVGTRTGATAFEEYLREYEATLRDQTRLVRIRADFTNRLFAGTNGQFEFDLLESFGQPLSAENTLVSLSGSPPGVRSRLAPQDADNIPGHDVPFFDVDENYAIPLTFDLFLALCLQKEGCENSSMPASVRAAIDRVRHLYAGQLCRDRTKIAINSARIKIRDLSLVLYDEDDDPRIAT